MERPRPEAAGARRILFDSVPPGALTWISPVTEPAVEDLLVRASFSHLVRSGALDARHARELGRAMGRVKGDASLAALLDAFSHLGLGSIRLLTADDDRFTFAANEAVKDEPAPNPIACSLTLGFVEGLAEVASRRQTLGSEMTCRSRGDETCTFNVRARPKSLSG